MSRQRLELAAIVVDALDPHGLARFWAELLGRPVVDDAHADAAVGPDDAGRLRLRFVSSSEPKTQQNRIHLDLTSATPADQHATVERVLALGGRHVDVGQSAEERHVVLGDPEGNELCVIEPGNRFLAGCGRLGAVNCDGTRAVGLFWSRVLGWPLVWDHDQETAVQPPRGGSKVTWSGPPLMPRGMRDRWRFDLVADGSLAAAVADLRGFGADLVEQEADEARLTDPDGNEFRLLLA